MEELTYSAHNLNQRGTVALIPFQKHLTNN